MDDENARKSREELLAEIAMLRARLEGEAERALPFFARNPDNCFFIDEALFPIVIVDFNDGSIIYTNTCAAQYFALTKKEMEGRKASDFWVDVEQRRIYVAMVSAQGRIHNFEAELLTAGGERKHTFLSAQKIRYHGIPAIYTVFADITNWKRMDAALSASESRYQGMYRLMQLMADTVPDMLWAKDLEDRYIFANKAIREKLLMCKDSESPIGLNDLFFAERERAEGQCHTFGEICVDSDKIVKSTCRAGRFFEDGMVRGKYLVLDVSKVPFFNENGQ